MKLNEIENNIPDFGITLIKDDHGKRGKSLGVKDIARVREAFDKYTGKSAQAIDDYVADTCQHLTNKQIAQAYVALGKYKSMVNTTSVKRARK